MEYSTAGQLAAIAINAIVNRILFRRDRGGDVRDSLSTSLLFFSTTEW